MMDNESQSDGLIHDNTFITKILGEMKKELESKSDEDTENLMQNSMNATEEIVKVESESSKDSTKDSDDSKSISSNNAEGDEQPRIVMCFRKPNKVSNKEENIGRRSKRNNKVLNNISLKRSTRRSSKDCRESVLQSAIARKEKSYNETSKPQRLTRQLKPTQKILDNIACAAAKKKDKSKPNAATKNNGKRGVKKLKANNKRESTDTETESLKFRRSDRKSVEDIKMEEEIDVVGGLKIGMDSNSASAQLIASRLCVCSHQTQIYAYAENDEDVFCAAIDSIGKKIIGCNNEVNPGEMPMLRPSTRVPYVLLCKVHRNRMVQHNCCPTCGIFCTQGDFSQCKKKHQFHRDCQITVGDYKCCPHCGDSTSKQDVYINMETSTPPVFSAQQNCSQKINVEDCIKVEERDCSSPPIIPLDGMKFSNISAKSIESSQYDIKDLLQSVKDGDYEEVASILGSRSVMLETLIDFDSDESGTILHYAAKNGLLPTIHMLKIAEMDLDILDSEQNTSLMVAVVNFQNDSVKYLTKAGASVTSKGMDGMTALHLAAKCGNLEACKILISAAVHIKGYKDYGDGGGWTPLVWSCEHSHVEIVKFLLTEGADPLLMDVEQNVALHWASFSGSSKIVELILNFGGEVNVVNSHGDSPLHIAARQDNFNCVLLLLARGAKIDVINKMGETPIDCCLKNSKSHEALSLNMQLQSLITVNKMQSGQISNDITHGIERHPIPCINEVDTEDAPSDFIYITKTMVTSDITIEEEVIQPCLCETKFFKDNWYDGGRLITGFDYEVPPMIFECDSKCDCKITCDNRIVQKGTNQNFQMIRTNDKGWGICTTKKICKGTFVCEYVGELISYEEADEREDDSYYFDLDNNEDLSHCIDAKFYGNYARFINHSCAPNLVPVKVFIEHQDLRFPRIALFASKDINAYEELSFNYGDEFWIVKCEYFTCKCKSRYCRYSEKSDIYHL